MRKINTDDFQRATRTTPREINRSIVLNLVREHQPISRAELARRMNTSRAGITALVNELLGNRSIYEGALVSAPSGRPSTMLHVRSHDRTGVSIDVRFSRTHILLTDLSGTHLAAESFATPATPEELADQLVARVRSLLRGHVAQGACEGIGLIVPGMVDRRGGRVLHAPALGWRNVDLGKMLASRLDMRVFIENAAIACALGQMWMNPIHTSGLDNFAYLTVSDGVGVGVVANGQVLRGHTDTAGEFGHLPLNIDGRRCLCGLTGCLEAYTSDLATLGRYLGLDPAIPAHREEMRQSGFSTSDLITRAQAGDTRAETALLETGRFLGVGLAGIITVLNPACVFVDGEIVAAWDLIGSTVRSSVRARTLTEATAATPIIPVSDGSVARLRGGTALLVAEQFAAPRVA